MFNPSHIEISRSAYISNIKYLKKIIGKEARISSVIKGNAYGHGTAIILPLGEEAGLDHFSVFSAQEALEAFKVKQPETRIMIMGHIGDDELEWAVENGLEFYVFEKNRLEQAIGLAKKTGRKARIHIEAETGFHRTGFEYAELPELVRFMKQNHGHLVFEGLCTHYAGAESLANYLRVKNQISSYRKFYSFFKRHGLLPNYRHTAGSAAALTYPATIMDMVRFGIAQYGFWPSPETQMFRFKKENVPDNVLKRALSWKSRVMVVKEVEAGQFVGYGDSYLANKKIKIAVIPVGYSNGFSRSLSNTGRVLIRGRRVPVIGTVTMNTMTVNVTDVPGVEQGDEVVMIGRQKRMNISIASFCEMSNQLNYQLLARLPANIPRIIVK
ncbi:MAG: alanine racemase [Bacteroides sp.]|jgi:alanine racemase|nr:alanine racemase [Bacteroides sp.]